MTIKNSGNPLSFQEIEAEFGSGGGDRRLGKYRRDDPAFNGGSPQNSFLGPGEDSGQLGQRALDDGIPVSGEIKFSDFYGKKLNMIIDYYSTRRCRGGARGGRRRRAAKRTTRAMSPTRARLSLDDSDARSPSTRASLGTIEGQFIE